MITLDLRAIQAWATSHAAYPQICGLHLIQATSCPVLLLPSRENSNKQLGMDHRSSFFSWESSQPLTSYNVQVNWLVLHTLPCRSNGSKTLPVLTRKVLLALTAWWAQWDLSQQILLFQSHRLRHIRIAFLNPCSLLIELRSAWASVYYSCLQRNEAESMPNTRMPQLPPHLKIAAFQSNCVLNIGQLFECSIVNLNIGLSIFGLCCG